jgi:hypothetical protein
MTIRLNWGTGIALAYLAFAAATLSFVAFALGRPVDLVSGDYYAQSLRQDQRMAAVRNAQELGTAASVRQTGDRTVVVTLPAVQGGRASGTVRLYRPSNAASDRVLALKVGADGRQQISLAGMAAGHWTVQVEWAAEGRDFYLEQPVVAR